MPEKIKNSLTWTQCGGIVKMILVCYNTLKCHNAIRRKKRKIVCYSTLKRNKCTTSKEKL